MLRNSLQVIDGIGPNRESDLWGKGVTTWDDLAAYKPQYSVELEQAEKQLQNGDAKYFQDILGNRESWRIYADFQGKTAFLDIETTGVSAENSYVTMVGILDHTGFTAYIRGENLDKLPDVLGSYPLFVSYNGTSFDMPFLDREFKRRIKQDGKNSLFSHAAHLDLRYPLRNMGFKGGLKQIEQATNTGRSSQLSGLSGYEAVRLWAMSNDGEPEALSTLVRYNAEDVVSLPKLTEIMVAHMACGTPMWPANPEPFPEYDTKNLPYDSVLVDYLTNKPGLS